jgi:serine protease Do
MPARLSHSGIARSRTVWFLSALALATLPIAAESVAQTVAVPPAIAARPQGFAELAEHLSPMVVNISTSQTLRRPGAQQNDTPAPPGPQGGGPNDDFFKNFLDRDNRPRRVQSLGSGFIIDPAGYVVTNNHVIDGADEITVILADTTSLTATLVGKDDKTDLALLKITPKAPLSVAKFGNSDQSRVGDLVMAIGDPFGLGGTVTAGIISARNRDINSGPYDDFIQTDASINRGNSGGPLFNMDGEVIGVNSAIYSPTGGSVGIGFSIPSNAAQRVIEQLRATGTISRGWLGVRIQTVTDEIAQSLGMDKAKGALIAGMTEGGPASKAGVQAGDVVVTFDGKPVVDQRALPRLVADTDVGKTVQLEVVRKGQAKTMPITIEKLVEDEKVASATANGAKPATPGTPTPQMVNLGMTLAPITGDSRKRFKLDEKTVGAVVTDVDNDSPAGQKNIRPGDVITEVAQQKVTTPEDVSTKLTEEKNAGRKVVLLQVSRGGELTFIGVRMP